MCEHFVFVICPDSVDWNTIILKHDWMYQHKVMHINYTTYDVQCAHDVMNNNSHHNIMLLAGSDLNTRLTNEAKF